jgi:phosphoribosylformimino-5-aminoimidazole carboxamide ribotide isomerase
MQFHSRISRERVPVRVIPAVDLRDGRCVQLIGGSYDREAIRLDNPVAVAECWAESGFRALHVVDLDAATGRGSNRDVILQILEKTGCEKQIGGGIRTTEDVADLLAAGADRVVVGTRALEDPYWLAEVAAQNPERLIVAMDIRDRVVVTRGWSVNYNRDYRDVINDLCNLPLGGLLVTAVHREGLMNGTDLPLMRDVVGRSTLPIQASGGIATVEDLRALTSAGVADVRVGMALYTGVLDQRSVIEEFAQ